MSENSNNNDVKILALYLPQFHPIEENDRAWGKGFTEWTNSTKARPNFDGHYQPKLPADLGFYDLRLKESQKQQVEMAKLFGIYGFCYMYFWFSGKRIMNTPIDSMLEDKSIEMPFCIEWANENWTRKWDGMEDNVIIKQDFNENDAEDFIDDLVKFFKDDRYIKIDGRPLMMIYRIHLIPDYNNFAKKLRARAKYHGFPDLYICGQQTFGLSDNKSVEYDIDSLMQYPPHVFGVTCHKKDTKNIKITNKEFSGHFFDYEATMLNCVDSFVKSKIKTFPGIIVSWDNTARRQDSPSICLGSSPQKYKMFLSKLIKEVKDSTILSSNEKFVVVNAWNEWAEGTYLEPDILYGKSYLFSTKTAYTCSERDVESYIDMVRKKINNS